MKSGNQTIVRCKQAIKIDILGRPFLSREASDVNTPCNTSMAGSEVHVSFAASSQTHSVQPIMMITPKCQFGSCTINFNTYK